MAKLNSLPSLNEIAREIGVSAATISRVLNGRSGIAEKTRKTVLSALEERGYPSKSVRGGFQTLRNGSATVAFAISSHLRQEIEKGDSFYGRHLLAIQAACSQFGFYPILVDYEQDVTPSGSLKCVEEQRVFGVVAEQMDPKFVESLREHASLVLLNAVSPVSGVDYVIPDIRQAAREQVKKLYDLGHRSIACFRSFPQGGWQNSYYWAEFWMQTQKLGLCLPPEFLEPITFSQHEEGPTIAAFLDRVLSMPSPPTAIITGDFYAAIIMEECNRRGFNVPERMSLVGFDDRPFRYSVPLSTYRQNFSAMAREALRALIDRCSQPGLPSRVIEVEGTLIWRESVAPPRAEA